MILKKEKEAEVIKEEEKWIWVDGYKGFDFNLQCNHMQYEVGKEYFMPAEEVVECKSGYHLCLRLRDVFNYYTFSTSEYHNRFCQVKALVREADYKKYGTRTDGLYAFHLHDKIVSKQIKIVKELSLDEVISIIYPGIEAEYAKNILMYGKNLADLIKKGYTPATVRWIKSKDLELTAEMLAENEEFQMKEKLEILINFAKQKTL